jgi:hypothetical protein
MPLPAVIDRFAVPFSFSRHPDSERLNGALKRYGEHMTIAFNCWFTLPENS